VSQTSFLRSVDLPFVVVASALHHWWERDEPARNAELGPSLQLGHVTIEPGLARAAVTIRRPRGSFRRTLRMELELSPLSAHHSMTRVELVARQRVRAGQRYFRAGHVALDALVAGVVAQRRACRDQRVGRSCGSPGADLGRLAG